MFRLILGRLFQAVPILLLVTLTIFLLTSAMADDAVRSVAGGADATPAQIEATRERLGLNEPATDRYVDFLGDLVTGDLGTSLYSSQTTLEAVSDRGPRTLVLVGAALLIAVIVAIPAGVLAALRPGGVLDRIVQLTAAGAVAVPSFVLGLLLVSFLAVDRSWFPVGGLDPVSEVGLGDFLRQLVLPGITLATLPAAEFARLTRAAVREVLVQDYIRAARAKGIPMSKVVGKHVLKNAAVPVVTVVGVSVGRLLSGAVIVETVFNINGLGTLVTTVISRQDYTIVQGVVMLSAVVVLAVNLLVDVSYGYFNPRVRGRL